MERLNQKEVGVGTSEFVPFSESDCLQINEDCGVQSKKISWRCRNRYQFQFVGQQDWFLPKISLLSEN